MTDASARIEEVRAVVGAVHPSVVDGRVEPLADRPGKAAVYVVRGLNSVDVVVAKLQDRRQSWFEERVYSDVLGALPVPSIRCHAYVPSCDPALAWLVTDHADGVPFDQGSREHADRLARWIGRVHVGAASVSCPADFPDHGSDYWREVVLEAVRVLHGGAENTEVTEEEREGLQALADVFSKVLARWEVMVGWMGFLPDTLTHGDLVPQNIRMGGVAPDLVPWVLDWGEAGWGSPVIDLLWVDLRAYLRSIDPEWTAPTLSTARILRALGAVLWTAFVLAGERSPLLSPWPHHAAAKAPAYLRMLEGRGARALFGADVGP